MRCACIDIGSNTTRLLVADADRAALREVLQRRVFTSLGAGRSPDDPLPPDRVLRVAEVVAAHARTAAELGATRLRAVATAAIRFAPNRDALVAAVRDACSVEVDVLDGDEEARLAFAGATRTLAKPPAGAVAVVDVGGGSAEVAVGEVAGGVRWSTSLLVGSASLTDACFAADPPAPAEVAAARARLARDFERLAPPAVEHAIAVGGSAASLRRLIGAEIGPGTAEQALERLCAAPAAEVARALALDARRVRLLPAGILILDVVRERLGPPLRVGVGGLREGVILELMSAEQEHPGGG